MSTRKNEWAVVLKPINGYEEYTDRLIARPIKIDYYSCSGNAVTSIFNHEGGFSRLIALPQDIKIFDDEFEAESYASKFRAFL